MSDEWKLSQNAKVVVLEGQAATHRLRFDSESLAEEVMGALRYQRLLFNLYHTSMPDLLDRSYINSH